MHYACALQCVFQLRFERGKPLRPFPSPRVYCCILFSHVIKFARSSIVWGVFKDFGGKGVMQNFLAASWERVVRKLNWNLNILPFSKEVDFEKLELELHEFMGYRMGKFCMQCGC